VKTLAKGRRGKGLRLACAGALLAFALPVAGHAQGLVPADFFNAEIDPAAPTAVEANTLTFDSVANVITASGDVVLRQGGYTMKGESLVYNRTTQEARFVGAVSVLDPSGNLAEMTDLELTGGMKQAFVSALTITGYDGIRITADSVDYDKALRTLLENTDYSPCGDCIDANGQRIGWSVHAARVVYDAEEGSLFIEQPTLSLLGIPVAWLPFLWLPDTSDSALASIPRPTYEYTEKTGHKLEFSYLAYANRWTQIVLTPTAMSRQGFLMGAEWIQNFDSGSFQIKVSGLYQADKAAFTFAEAARDWRGAIQSSGTFKPAENWTTGWSYTTFTDAAYLPDYGLTRSNSRTNEVYATYLDRDTYFDGRLQQFQSLGDVTMASQGAQGAALPALRFEQMHDLGEGKGRIEISGRLLGVHRRLDSFSTVNGVNYDYGYAGTRQHLALQGGWQTQWIGGGGFVATPYLGGRADLAYYDNASTLATAPGTTTLWSATPIAAMDVRFPLAASDGSTVHLVEPIAQLVYRGGDTLAGIANDDSENFVFDDTNLFSFNRFSGIDRQETGLRANIGARYQANFANGSYIELIAGQSFHLAGQNGFARLDQVQSTAGSGLESNASYTVLGAYAAFEPGFEAGGKLQVDTGAGRVTRGALNATYSHERYSASADYVFHAANPALGMLADQHEIGGEIRLPLAEYWSVRAAASWDIAANKYLQVGGGLTYDDGYLVVGGNVTRNGPTHITPDDLRITATIRLKAPAGFNAGYEGAVPSVFPLGIGF